MPETPRYVGYFRVSTDAQGDSGAGLAAQMETVAAERKRRGWVEVDKFTDIASGKSIRKRPNLERALAVMERGEADLLVVAKLDRLSRSLLDFASLMARAQEQGWGIVAIDIGVDTSTINGELVANIIMSLAQWERRIIGQRTKDALGAVKSSGTKLGRPSNLDPSVAELIRMLVADGRSYRSVAERLNAKRVPTSQGGRWHASTVRLIATR